MAGIPIEIQTPLNRFTQKDAVHDYFFASTCPLQHASKLTDLQMDRSKELGLHIILIGLREKYWKNKEPFVSKAARYDREIMSNVSR